MTLARLLVINPNTNADMTAMLCSSVERHVAPGTRVIGRTAAFGCPVIATRASFAIAAHAALDSWAAEAEPVDAIILGCFGDPGLAALREIASVPVVGLAEASFAVADAPFAVLTAGAPWREMLREQLAVSPRGTLCRGIWALDATGADVVRDPQGFVAALDALAERAVGEGAERLILGGAALAGYAPRLRPIAPFIDCVAAAVRQLPSATVRPTVLQPGPAAGLSPDLSALFAPAPLPGG